MYVNWSIISEPLVRTVHIVSGEESGWSLNYYCTVAEVGGIRRHLSSTYWSTHTHTHTHTTEPRNCHCIAPVKNCWAGVTCHKVFGQVPPPSMVPTAPSPGSVGGHDDEVGRPQKEKHMHVEGITRVITPSTIPRGRGRHMTVTRLGWHRPTRFFENCGGERSHSPHVLGPDSFCCNQPSNDWSTKEGAGLGRGGRGVKAKLT